LRTPKMANIYKQMAKLQDVATKIYSTDPKGAVSMLSKYCYNTSVGWFNDWLKLGTSCWPSTGDRARSRLRGRTGPTRQSTLR